MSRWFWCLLPAVLMLPSLHAAQPACSDVDFPPSVIAPEVIREIIKGKEIVSQIDLHGRHEGKLLSRIDNGYEVELPGFTGNQRVTVGSLQNDGTIIYFKGPGFLYLAEGGKLIRKTLIRLSSVDMTVLEQGIRHATASRNYVAGRTMFLEIRKENESSRPTKEFLDRVSDLDIALRGCGEWNPDIHSLADEAIAEIGQSTPDRVKFHWTEAPYHKERREWHCEFVLKEGTWVKIDD